jgi:hypothetical protein
LIVPPLTIDEAAHEFESSVGLVNIHAVVPICEAELQFKREKGPMRC